MVPEQHLWSCDDQGNVYYLSSWEAGWRRLRSRRGHQLRVKRIVASGWCIWAIAADQSPYLLVPSDGATIRVSEIITQYERWTPTVGFSGSNLTAKDPPEYLQSGCESFSWTTLPSTRWHWESKAWDYLVEHSGDKAGWEYSTSFSPDSVFSSFYRPDCVVRRRRWQRFRRFVAHDRWLLCSVQSNDLDPQKSCSQIVHVHKLAIGGQRIPCQLPGFLVVWIVTKDGRVICRTNVHRSNPEGSSWVERHLLQVYDQNSSQVLPAPHQPFAIDICSNQFGQTFILTDECQLFRRIGVSKHCPYGYSWAQVTWEPSWLVLRDHEHLVSMGVGGLSVWLLANTGRVWFHPRLATAVSTHVGALSVDLDHPWSAMAGRLAALAVSPSDQVFALDKHSGRLIYRSGITPETPGGEAWVCLQLPILPSIDDDSKLDLSDIHEGPLLPLCVPQDESIQLVSKVIQLATPSLSDSLDETIERLSAPDDYDPNSLPQISPGQLLGHKLRKFFTPRQRSREKSTCGGIGGGNNCFVSFRNLLLPKEATMGYSEKGDIGTVEPDWPQIGRSPTRLIMLWAGALDSLFELHVPHRWRIAALLSEKKNLIPYFATETLPHSPEWLWKIETSLPSPISNFTFNGIKFQPAFGYSEPWNETYCVDMLSAASNDPKQFQRCSWTRKHALITHFYSKTRLTEFSIVNPPSVSCSSIGDDATEVTSAFQISQKITLKEIVWAGHIDPTSALIPRTPKDVYANGRRKFSDNVPIRKPGEEATADISNSSSSRKVLPTASFTSTCGRLVAVFVRNEKAPTPPPSFAPTQTESLDELDGETSSDVFEEHPAVVESVIMPRWVLRFPSRVEASAWLKETQIAESVIPASGRIWMVTEQAEVYWATGTALDANLTWSKVSGHLASIDSISVGGKGGGQLTWALGHDGTPWVHREDWMTAPQFSQKHFPLKTPHWQTDRRQYRVYEFQARRILHGYSSSKAFNERGVMWSRDARHQQPCSLSDYHLPPHTGRVRWLDDWEVDFSPLRSPLTLFWPFASRYEEPVSHDSINGGSRSRRGSTSISPHGSPIHSTVDFGSTASSVGSLEVVITVNQPQVITTTVTSTGTGRPATPASPSPSNLDFREGGVYSGTEEGYVAAVTQTCDAKGWLYTPRSFVSGYHRSRSCGGGGSGVRHRRWVRSYAVSTEAPWQEVGALRLRCLCLSRPPSTSSQLSIDVWAVTEAGELVYRKDVSPASPAGSSWEHYPTRRRLICVATAPEDSSDGLWVVCADFGLLWRIEECRSSSASKWRCFGFAPSGAAWHRLAPVDLNRLWALDVDGHLWVYSSANNASNSEEDLMIPKWIRVASPRVSDISCSSDGKIWVVFSATNTLAVRTGISAKVPIGTGWLSAFKGIVSSVCIKGGLPSSS